MGPESSIVICQCWSVFTAASAAKLAITVHWTSPGWIAFPVALVLTLLDSRKSQVLRPTMHMFDLVVCIKICQLVFLMVSINGLPNLATLLTRLRSRLLLLLAKLSLCTELAQDDQLCSTGAVNME